MAPSYVFSTFAFLGLLFSIIPFPWHWQAKNSGTCLYMFWAAIGCLNMFVNSVVWAKDAINYAPIWCDISVRLIIGVSIGIPAASLCINRRLYHIAACTTAAPKNEAQKKRDVVIDLAIGLGLPVLQMILQYTVQGHRFDIFEEIGCIPAQYNSVVLIPVSTSWPIIIGLVSLSYCVRSIYHIWQRQAQFKQYLSVNTDMNRFRYIRLMCLAGLEAICTVPLATYIMSRNLRALRPVVGWAKVHWRFSRVSQYPSMLWRWNKDAVFALELTRWSPVICAILFFFFFGFADEARKNYRLVYTSVAKRLGYSTASTSTAVSSTTDMRSKNFRHLLSGGKVEIHREVSQKRDSIGSFDLTIVDVGGLLDDVKPSGFTPTASFGSSSPTTPFDRSSVYLPSPTEVGSPVDIARPEPTVTRHSAESSPIRPTRSESLHLPMGSHNAV